MKADELTTLLDLTLCDAVFCVMRTFREHRSMTQGEVAEKMEVHAVAVSKMERHTQKDVKLLTMARYADGVGVSLVELVTAAETMWGMVNQVIKQMTPQQRGRAYESLKDLDKGRMLTVLMTMGATNG